MLVVWCSAGLAFTGHWYSHVGEVHVPCSLHLPSRALLRAPPLVWQVGVVGCCARINNGDTVRVDADSNTVEVIKRA